MVDTVETRGAHDVASRRCVAHGCAMAGHGCVRAKRLLPMTRRERALAAKLDDARASLAAMAAVVRNFSALEDARTHLMVKAARERRSGMAEDVAGDPATTAFGGVKATHIDSAAARSKVTAELLDRVTEALERLAASLRDT